MMISDLIDIASSGGVGAIVGAVGSWAAKREARKMKKIDNEHEKDMAEIGLREMSAEHNHAIQLVDKEIQKVKQEGDTKIELGELGAFSESLKTFAVSSGIAAVEAIRKLMRPLITTYLLALTTYLAYKVGAEVGGLEAIPANELFTLYSHVINQTIFLTTVAVTWWFGSRDWGVKR